MSAYDGGKAAANGVSAPEPADRPRPRAAHGAPIGASLDAALARRPAAGRGSEPLGGLRLRTLILLRWVAAVGQASAIGVVHFGLGFDLPLNLAAAVVAALALSNVALSITRPATARLGDRDGAVYLGFDVLQLSVLLFLTGGLHNPFSLFLIAPVVIGAIALSTRSIIGLSLLALACVALLDVYALPLPWVQGTLLLPPLYAHGIGIAIGIAIMFITVYAWVVAENARRMARALGAAEMALAREQRAAALGALSAAIAHNMGTPLATIAVTARELQRELAPDHALAEDVASLVEQTQRCREILAELSQQSERHGESDAGSPAERLPLHALLEAAAAPYADRPRGDGRPAPQLDIRSELAADQVALHADAGGEDDVDPELVEPEVWRRPEVLHGLGNLIQNAMQFAARRVEVSAQWDRERIVVTVQDDGPGFSPGVLGNLGEPYLSDREDKGHLGLGVFIAKTLLEYTGASLRFRNARPSGARVAVLWPRNRLEARIAEPAAGSISVS